MPSVLYFIDSLGRTQARDPNKVAFINRQGVSGVYLRAAEVDVSKLTVGDAGLIVRARAADNLGSGEGSYEWDGYFFRRVGKGVAATITCTAGESILTLAQRQIVMGSTTLRITAASPLTVGTATTKPILPDGYSGQELTIINVGSNAITLTDVAGMALSNLKLIAASTALATLRGMKLVFDDAATAGQRWRQINPTTALLD